MLAKAGREGAAEALAQVDSVDEGPLLGSLPPRCWLVPRNAVVTEVAGARST